MNRVKKDGDGPGDTGTEALTDSEVDVSLSSTHDKHALAVWG